jgi:hypothetical protein
MRINISMSDMVDTIIMMRPFASSTTAAERLSDPEYLSFTHEKSILHHERTL